VNSPRHFRPLHGSERVQPVNAKRTGDVDQGKSINLTIYVRPAQSHPGQSGSDKAQGANSGRNPTQFVKPEAHALSPADFEANPKDLDAVADYATKNHLKVMEKSQAKRSVSVEGKISDAAAAFGVELGTWEHRGVRYRGRTGAIQVPAQLGDIVEAVFGFDNRPLGRPYIRRSHLGLISHRNAGTTYLPPDLASIYDFPGSTDGTGQTIAIMTFNGALGDGGDSGPGGYSAALLGPYFNEVKLQVPKITNIVVHGPGNVPGPGTSDDDSTGEVLLDICMAASLAPKANFVMYFTEFTEQGWVDAMTSAVTATSNRPNVISISYGNPEDGPAGEILWTRQAISKVNEALQRAALGNITVCCAAGDAGSSDGIDDGRQHVDFPASSPWALGCGGTRLIAVQDVITSETVWNDGPGDATGGGISAVFPVPSYQTSAAIPPSVNPGSRHGRGVPDVAGLADPETGVMVASPDGSVQQVGGTSATAPLWAALVARLNQALGTPVGFLNPHLYDPSLRGVLRDIVDGNNGSYTAATGWDACSGLGSPNGVRLLNALKGGASQ
jgi:kumamolisin